MRDCGCLGAIILGIIAGAIIGFLTISGIIVGTTVVTWIAFGISFFVLTLLVLLILFGDDDTEECICENGLCLLAGIIGTIILAVSILAVIGIASVVALAVLFGLGGLFFTLMLVSLVRIIICTILSECEC